ncbi:MAG: PRC-barrel domain-containing protein [Anaerolineae bacterium]|nr:PRC-barrel domain-containing protein [Anaerolineae bacterium]
MDLELHEGTSVYTSDGKDVGRIERVVLDPTSKKVTHVIIRQGFLFTEDKVVPIRLFASAHDDRAVLREDSGDLDALPPFEEKHYIPAYVMEGREPDYTAEAPGPLFWYPPAGGAYYAPGLYTAPTVAGWPYESGPRYVERTDQNIPDDTVAIAHGARVITSDDAHVGDVDEVIVDSQSHSATHLVISQGLLLKSRKLIPILWVSTVSEDEVWLGVDRSFVDTLPDYEG